MIKTAWMKLKSNGYPVGGLNEYSKVHLKTEDSGFTLCGLLIPANAETGNYLGFPCKKCESMQKRHVEFVARVDRKQVIMSQPVKVYVVQLDDMDNGSTDYELFLELDNAKSYILSEVNKFIQDSGMKHKPFKNWRNACDFASEHERFYKIIDKILTK